MQNNSESNQKPRKPFDRKTAELVPTQSKGAVKSERSNTTR